MPAKRLHPTYNTDPPEHIFDIDVFQAESYYSHIENHKRIPRRPVALRIAAALGFPTENAQILADLAQWDRIEARGGPDLPADTRALIRALCLAAPLLSPSAIARLTQTLNECSETSQPRI